MKITVPQLQVVLLSASSDPPFAPLRISAAALNYDMVQHLITHCIIFSVWLQKYKGVTLRVTYGTGTPKEAPF